MNSIVERNHTDSISDAWKMLIWLLVAQIAVAFVGRSLAPLSILIGKDLSLTNAQIGMMPAALFFGQLLVSIPSGLLVDRIGTRKQLLTITFCLGCSFTIITLSNSFWLLLMAVVLGGGAYGAMHPATNRGIFNWFSQQKRGTAMGIKQMGVTFGAALTALLLLPISKEIGWRPVLFMSCIFLICIGVLTNCFYRDAMPIQKHEASVQPPEKKQSIIKQVMTMFQHKPLLFISISLMGLQGAQLCLTTYLVIFAYEKLGLSLLTAGILLVIAEIGGSCGRIAWGGISDFFFRGERLIILIIITAFSGVFAFIFAFLGEGTPLFVVGICVFLFGFCISGYNGIWMNIATELVPREQTGLATGVTITISSWGVIFIPPLFGYIIDRSGSFSGGWIFLLILMGLVFLLLKHTDKHLQQMKNDVS
ncbi:MFS transporter [Cytobacillus sp. FSL R5-0569]|uniref:MFS transporter n=1 Tax=Cytobacillus TaxID=2675230 RepID=UPI00277D8F35|nr:MFS transporter [Cytobacillus kochii]MDQ0185873.1 sugar phosphate permease [Cytobacillus kochii]